MVSNFKLKETNRDNFHYVLRVILQICCFINY
jgi:hypothetical protein